jgi:hypothetical protein
MATSFGELIGTKVERKSNLVPARIEVQVGSERLEVTHAIGAVVKKYTRELMLQHSDQQEYMDALRDIVCAACHAAVDGMMVIEDPEIEERRAQWRARAEKAQQTKAENVEKNDKKADKKTNVAK